jgi:hypothetical protein
LQLRYLKTKVQKGVPIISALRRLSNEDHKFQGHPGPYSETLSLKQKQPAFPLPTKKNYRFSEKTGPVRICQKFVVDALFRLSEPRNFISF